MREAEYLGRRVSSGVAFALYLCSARTCSSTPRTFRVWFGLREISAPFSMKFAYSQRLVSGRSVLGPRCWSLSRRFVTWRRKFPFMCIFSCNVVSDGLIFDPTGGALS